MARKSAAEYSHRPAILRLANFAGRRLPLAASVPLQPEALISAAVRRAGSDDFGPDSWRRGFERLCQSLENEARLNLVGHMAARRHLLQLLVNRLCIEKARRNDKTIAQRDVTAPVFVTGLPRTGSTLLHGLIAQDPGVRVPWTWEVMLPTAGTDDDAGARISRTDAMLRWVHRLAPRFRTIHPVGARLPQECIAITAHEFASVEFHTTFDVPAYQRWLDADNQEAALAYHRRFVQHLQHDARRWVFKAPAHLYALPAITQVYPDARFVFTTRDPSAVIGSIASHGVVLRCAFSDEVDVPSVARDWMRWWAEGWRRAQEFRAQHRERFIDLDYETLVADPVAAVTRLYDQLGLPLDEAARQRMQDFLQRNRQNKHGRHRYTLEQFGLDPAEVRALFDDHSNTHR